MSNPNDVKVYSGYIQAKSASTVSTVAISLTARSKFEAEGIGINAAKLRWPSIEWANHTCELIEITEEQLSSTTRG